MQELVMTPSTLILLGIILALAALAVHRLVKRGACDCNDHCGGSCGKCSAADDIVRKMEAAAKE